MRLNPRKTKSLLGSRCRIIAPGCSDLILGGAELVAVMSLSILGVTLESRLTCETHLWEVVSKQLGVWESCTEQELFDCSSGLKSSFNAYVLFS